ncbi:hypothetical protein SGRI78S_03220 [Streptomyces griseus subsp. griseus]
MASTSASWMSRVSQKRTVLLTVFVFAAGLERNRPCTGPSAWPVTSIRSVSWSTVTVIIMVITSWPSHRVNWTPR